LGYAIIQIFWRFTFSGSTNPISFQDLAKIIVGVLFEEFGAVRPARTTAGTPVTLYRHFYHDSPSNGRFNKRSASTCSELVSRIKILEAFLLYDWLLSGVIPVFSSLSRARFIRLGVMPFLARTSITSLRNSSRSSI